MGDAPTNRNRCISPISMHYTGVMRICYNAFQSYVSVGLGEAENLVASVRDAEAAGSNPVNPTRILAGQRLYSFWPASMFGAVHYEKTTNRPNA